MANPAVKSTIPALASLKAALWVSDQIDQAGTPTKGAWDAVTGTFYPCWDGASLTAVALGSSGQNGLVSAAANCGIALAGADDHTGTVFDFTTSTWTILALVRPVDVVGISRVFQNRQKWSPNKGLSLTINESFIEAINTGASSTIGTALSSSGAAVASAAMTMAVVSTAGSVQTYKNGTSTGAASTYTSPPDYGASGLNRRAALFNTAQSGAVTADPIEIYAVLIWEGAALSAAQLQSFGTTEAALLAGSLHAAAFETPSTATVVTNPTNQSAVAPATATFTASFSGSPTPTVQWQRQPAAGGGYTDISGATSTSYTTGATSVTGGSHNHNDTYRCVGTNTGGSATTTAATLTVTAAPTGPTITAQPTNQSVTSPSVGTFGIAATGSGTITYQLQRQPLAGGGYSNVAGASTTGASGATVALSTGATAVTGGSHNNGDTYRITATDSNGPTTSSVVTLTVAAPVVLGVITSSPLKNNTGTLQTSAPLTAGVYNTSTDALVLRKTGLTSHATTAVATFSDAGITPGTTYRVVWHRTDTGAEGMENLTAA